MPRYSAILTRPSSELTVHFSGQGLSGNQRFGKRANRVFTGAAIGVGQHIFHHVDARIFVDVELLLVE